MFISFSAAETEATGAKLAEQLQAGDAVALVGDLGAGKTHFVKGIARALKCSGIVTSPTFTLLHEYWGGRLPVFHFDFYRVENVAALHGIGFDEYVFGTGVTVIEWADRFAAAIPTSALWIKLRIKADNVREID